MEKMNSEILICGDVKSSELHNPSFQSNDNQIEFLIALQKLMYKYNIDKLDIGWKRYTQK